MDPFRQRGDEDELVEGMGNMGLREQAEAFDLRYLIDLRRSLRKSSASHTFQIVGVSFGNRQTLLQSLHEGQAVMMVHEPENQHDEYAVAVKTLSGEHLGYVPRKINQQSAFRRRISLGHIRSAGPAYISMPHNPLWGADVVHQPALRPLLAEAIPEHLKQACDSLIQQLPEGKMARIERACRRPFRCDISGRLAEQLCWVPVWVADEMQRQIVLKGFRYILPELESARNKLLDESNNGEAAEIFKIMNEWDDDEVDSYMQYLWQLRDHRTSTGDWTIDASWLSQNALAR